MLRVLDNENILDEENQMNTIDVRDDDLRDDQLVLLIEVKLEPKRNILFIKMIMRKNELNQHCRNVQKYIKQLASYIVEQDHRN